jgi:hypothetical protein
MTDYELTDFAELNAPPVVNYGVVYPQSILIFVITLLYSVSQPLILLFGALYFGVAYVVYKYRLLFGAFIKFVPSHLLMPHSILQTIRVARSGVAYHIYALDMGRSDFSYLYDWKFHLEAFIHPIIACRATDYRYCGMGMVY